MALKTRITVLDNDENELNLSIVKITVDEKEIKLLELEGYSSLTAEQIDDLVNLLQEKSKELKGEIY